MRLITGVLIASTLAGAVEQPAVTTRLKDVVTLEGVRDNQLVGYGLVVGLAGTGDRRQTMFSAQSLANMLERMGISVPGATIRVSNTAAVMLTATLPPFAQPGSRIDITAAAVGDATNLQGGLLLLTPLKGPDGNVYAAAQGAVVTGGFVAGKGGNSQTLNHPTVGRIPGGGIIERAAPSVPPSGKVRLQLREADFSTSARIAQVINKRFGTAANAIAVAENSAAIRVQVPSEFQANPVAFIAELENLQVSVDGVARVVINERTGTIVMGRDVHIAPVTIMQGGLTVEIRTTPLVSQPEQLSQGKTQVVEQTTTTAKEDKARNLVLKKGASVEDLVRALNAIGSTPRDIIAILQALRIAGALDAAVEVI